ncbi:MAG: hypothetical protein GY722_20345, partial [bacterium]|nr:hypothetical protein [bacterium]
MKNSTLSSKLWCARVALALFAVLTLGFASIAGAATPLSGDRIGNQASATYTDALGNPRAILSNLVETEVTQIGGVLVSPAGTTTLTSPAGSQVNFPMSVTNTGNGSDTFNLTAVDTTLPDFTMTSVLIYADGGGGTPTGSPIVVTPAIAALGGSFDIVVVAVTPATAVDGDFNNITVTATSVFDAGESDSATAQTEISDDAVITVNKSISPTTSGDPGDTGFTVTIQYQNIGNDTATSLVLTDALPVGMSYVANSGRWSVTGATVLTDADGADLQGTAPNQIVYDYNVTAATTVTATVSQVLPGQTGEVTFQFDIPAGASAGVLGNLISFSYDDGSGVVGPFNSNNVGFTINQVYAVNVSDDTVASANQGGTVDFTNVITNNGNGSDTFTISSSNVNFPVGTVFQIFESDGVTPFVSPTTLVAAGATYTVILRATLPPSATGGPYTANLTALSIGDGSVSDSGVDQLTLITTSTVDLTNNGIVGGCGGTCPGEGIFVAGEAAAVETESTLPGGSITHVLFVNNLSGVTDNYDLAASTDSSFASISLPAGWTVSFENSGGTPIANTGNIAAGGNFEVRAIVSVPAGEAAQPSPGQSIFFRALSPLTLSADVKHDSVEVLTQRSMVVAPNNAGTSFPGGFVDYGHTLTNNGNVTENSGGLETVTLSMVNAPATFTSVLYLDVNSNGAYDAGTDTLILTPADIGAIAPGASVDLVIRVTVPGGASLGSTATTTLTATTAGTINGVAAPAADSADDVTTVSENVDLVKTQAIDTACNGTFGAFVSTLLTAAPGECIQYRIIATNNAAADVDSVVITDATPTNTTYNT